MKFQLVSDDNRRITLNMDAINAYTSRWVPHTSFDLELTRRVAKKSDPMRHFYWAVVVRTYGEHLGYDADELELLHRQLKIVYFKVEPDKKGVYRNVPSVFSNDSELPVPEKKKFLDWVVRVAARDDCYIPMPDEK